MSFETPFVEYLIIGTHTCTWLLLMIMAILGIPLQSLTLIKTEHIIFLLPFVYLLGTLFSSISNFPLRPFRGSIRKQVFPNGGIYKDEIIAHKSPELYKGYTSRMHRVRLMGASIFNWILLGFAFSLHTDPINPHYYIPAVIFPIILSVLSGVAFYSLEKRALEYRKTAIDVIRDSS